MKLALLDIRDEAVQAFLWKYIEPTDLRHDYTRLDAMKEIERQVHVGDAQLWGDMEAGIMLRVTVRNPKVIEPHIMGDGTKIRTLFEQGLAFAWRAGFEKVVIYTQHAQIASIVERLGFKREAWLPRIHMGPGGDLLDLGILTMEKPHAL